MPNIRFTRKHNSKSLRFRSWRELNRGIHAAKAEDEEHATAVAERAEEMREELEFLLSPGLSEGAYRTHG